MSDKVMIDYIADQEHTGGNECGEHVPHMAFIFPAFYGNKTQDKKHGSYAVKNRIEGWKLTHVLRVSFLSFTEIQQPQQEKKSGTAYKHNENQRSCSIKVFKGINAYLLTKIF
jgi:hypothetical protein